MREQAREQSPRRRGSSLLEGVLAMLPFLAIMFSVLDLSIAIKNTAQFAVCQGVRYAVTSQTLSGMGQDASITVRGAGINPGITVAKRRAAGIRRIVCGHYGGGTPCRRTGPLKGSGPAPP
jgi:hypothetical protein